MNRQEHRRAWPDQNQAARQAASSKPPDPEILPSVLSSAQAEVAPSVAVPTEALEPGRVACQSRTQERQGEEPREEKSPSVHRLDTDR